MARMKSTSSSTVSKGVADVKLKRSWWLSVRRSSSSSPKKSNEQQVCVDVVDEQVVFYERKWSAKLGEKWHKGVPIEVLPLAYKITKKEIEKQLGGEVVVREGVAKLVRNGSDRRARQGKRLSPGSGVDRSRKLHP